MSAHTAISLQLTDERLRALCERLLRQSPRIEQALAALVTLQSLLATCADPATQAGADYAQLKRLLDDYSEQARQQLIAQSGERLAAALAARDSQTVATIYAALSRSGFTAALEQALAHADADMVRDSAAWARQWQASARQRGEAASGCPDAIDFTAAGIDIMEYNAMADMVRVIDACLQ